MNNYKGRGDYMNIATSYIANFKKYNGRVPICIMRWELKYFNGIYYYSLAPSWKLLFDYKHNNITFETFHDEMIKQLEKLDSKKIFTRLEKFGNNIVLLGTCKDYDHCHRKIVADWLSKELNIEIKEL